MTDVFIGDRTWKKQWKIRLRLVPSGHDVQMGITNQHWSISTYHSGRLWFFRSLQPCSLRLPDSNCDGQAIGLFDLANESEGRLCQAIFFSTKLRNASVMSATVYSDNISLRNLWYLVVSSSFLPTTQKAFALAFAFAFAFALALAFALGFGAALASPVNVRILNHWITLDSWTCLNNSA